MEEFTRLWLLFTAIPCALILLLNLSFCAIAIKFGEKRVELKYFQHLYNKWNDYVWSESSSVASFIMSNVVAISVTLLILAPFTGPILAIAGLVHLFFKYSSRLIIFLLVKKQDSEKKVDEKKPSINKFSIIAGEKRSFFSWRRT